MTPVSYALLFFSRKFLEKALLQCARHARALFSKKNRARAEARSFEQGASLLDQSHVSF